MKREIKTTLALDGEKKFKQGLDTAARQLRVLDSELKANTASFATNERSLESLTSKGQLFERRISQQKEVIKALSRAVKESSEMYGDASAKTDGYRIKLNNATASLAKMERELEQNSQAMSELGQDTGRAASKMDRLKSKAKELQSTLKKTGEGLSDAGQKMSVGVTAPIIAGIGLATEGTRDFRGDIARLKTNARSAGQDMEVLNKAMAEMYAITGEVDSNVEGFSNILATGFRNDDILKIMEALAGASIKWSDTLKFEGLADGLQETLATGKSIGPFDEMLSRAGVNLDDFNAGLQKAIKNGTQEQYILQQLAKSGVAGYYEEYKKLNPELYESGKAHYEMQAAMGELGNKLDPLVTKVVKTVTTIIDKFNELSPTSQDLIIKFGLIAAALGPVLTIVGKGMIFFALFGDKLGGFTKILASTAGFVTRFGGTLLNLATKIGPLVIQFATRLGPMMAGLAGPIGIAVAAVVTLISIFKRLWDTSPAFRNWVRDLGDSLKNGLGTAINFVVDQLNWLIGQINRLPKVNIDKVGYVTKPSGTRGVADFRKLDQSSIGRNAAGTDFWRGGLSWVGEHGPELINLPRGAQVFSNRESMALANQTITIGGTVRVEGVNNMGQLVGVTKIIAQELERGDRRIPGRVRVMPSMA